MFELPLFPLSSVLFPGMPINLHIFEERYKLMVTECIENKQPFGVVLIQDGQEAGDPNVEPYLIGCTAHITEMQPLDDGRMNIVAVGKDRFIIERINNDKPYMTGTVELYPLAHGDLTLLAESTNQLREWVNQYLHLLEQEGKVQYDSKLIPTKPLELAYLGALLLQDISQAEKQRILESPRASIMISRLRYLYSREVQLLEFMLNQPDHIQFVEYIEFIGLGPFVLN